MSLDAREQEIFDLQGAETGPNVVLQEQVVDLALRDELTAAGDLLYTKTVPGQDRVFVNSAKDLTLEVPLSPTLEEHHCEILLRMVDGDSKLVPPGAFIPAAERYGLMYDIDRCVISAAFDHLSAHPSCVADPHQPWTINLSGQSICKEHFLEFVTEQFRNKRVPARNICFKMTETTAIRNLGRAAELMSTLKAMGCRFALDDFGSGLSSFNCLKHLDTDFLKIDGSFVKDMLGDARDCAMVESINQIGQLLGLRTIAEWVEHEQVFTKLPALRIDFAQGYYIHKPEPLPHGVAAAAYLHDARAGPVARVAWREMR